MSRLTWDRTAEPVSRDQVLRHARGQGNNNFPCSADHEQDCQPYPVDPYSAICDDHTYIHTYIQMDAAAEFGMNPISKHQVQLEYGDEQADAGRDCRTRLARPNSQARTGTGKKSFSLFS